MATVAPLRVSPFIKFCRWGLLFSGILYGMSKHRLYSKLQTDRRVAYESTRPQREAKAKAEKEKQYAEQMADLEKTLGVKFG